MSRNPFTGLVKGAAVLSAASVVVACRARRKRVTEEHNSVPLLWFAIFFGACGGC